MRTVRKDSGKRILRIAQGFLVVLIIAATCAGQASQKKSEKKARPPASSFVCPDPEAQKACKSYQELLKAKDSGLPIEGYVCFQKNLDVFFVVLFSRPYFPRRWDKELKEMVVDTESNPPGHGYAQSYKDGIADSAVPPSLFFSGTWIPYPESGTFTSNEVNFKKQDTSDADVGVSIDETQFIAGYKYQNRFDKTITYKLTIQRSTGRFSESFQVESEKLPFSENSGHCIYR